MHALRWLNDAILFLDQIFRFGDFFFEIKKIFPHAEPLHIQRATRPQISTTTTNPYYKIEERPALRLFQIWFGAWLRVLNFFLEVIKTIIVDFQNMNRLNGPPHTQTVQFCVCSCACACDLDSR